MKKELATSLNGYLANTGVLYVKVHNLHWNVVGPQFKGVHEYLEVLYNAFADVLDDTAELLKIHEETPLASLKSYLAVATVEELESVDVSVSKVLETLIADLTLMKKHAESVRTLADEEDAYDVVALMEDHLTNYNKNLWFLRAMTK